MTHVNKHKKLISSTSHNKYYRTQILPWIWYPLTVAFCWAGNRPANTSFGTVKA